jgi:hypothetical protein
MRSIRLSDVLYGPAVGVMTLSLALQIFCFVVKIFC